MGVTEKALKFMYNEAEQVSEIDLSIGLSIKAVLGMFLLSLDDAELK